MWRRTPQTTLVKSILSEKGHATNQELAVAARKVFPDITNTTVHRITARLIESGLAQYAPSMSQVKVVDVNTEDHDHFLCQSCHRLVDISMSDETFTQLQKQLPGELSRKNIVVAGVCKKCEC